jgi:hypothetical protein
VSSLEGLVPGDLIRVHDSQGRYRREVVAKVGRVWLYDGNGDKYKIADGEAEERLQVGHGTRAVTVAEWEVIAETKRLTVKLLEWGWVPSLKGKTLTLAQLRRAGEFLDGLFLFSDDLPEHLAGHSFGRMGCRVIEGENALAARARGSAAECAADAAELLRIGEVGQADETLYSARQYVIRWRAEK